MFARVDEYGKFAWFGIVFVAFWLAWPVGLATLAFLAGSGRLRTWRNEMSSNPGQTNGQNFGKWFNMRDMAGSRAWPDMKGWRSSGNTNFDEYRRAELDRLEIEEREFKAFLDRLRRARDKEEFDRFMDERRRPVTTTQPADER